MATRMNSFTKTGVALASAAAVVAATPVLAPSISTPTPPALSKAAYEMTNFATFLEYLTDPLKVESALFDGWGFKIGPINVDPEEPNPNYWAPQCNYDCTINGPSGVAYMLLDALINGDAGEPATWPVNALNYAFEAGAGIALQYIAQQPFQPGVLENPDLPPGPDNPYLIPPGPLANQAIFDAIALVWQGPVALTTILLGVVAPVLITTVGSIPFVGPVVAGGLSAYFYGFSDELNGISGPAGLSGVLAYVTDIVTQAIVGLGDLLPTAAASTPATTLVAAAAAAPSVPSAAPLAAATEAPAESTPAVAEPAAVEADDSKEASPSGDAVATPVDESPAEAPVETPAEPADAAEESKPVTPVEAPADDATVSAPAEAEPAPAKAPKRSVRGAVERVTKSVQSALGGEKAEAADTTGSASSDADSADSAE